MTGHALRRVLQKRGVVLTAINPRAFAVDEADLDAYLAARGEYQGVGRPRKAAEEGAASA